MIGGGGLPQLIAAMKEKASFYVLPLMNIEFHIEQTPLSAQIGTVPINGVQELTSSALIKKVSMF